jgi:hypothetical protein
MIFGQEMRSGDKRDGVDEVGVGCRAVERTRIRTSEVSDSVDCWGIIRSLIICVLFMANG